MSSKAVQAKIFWNLLIVDFLILFKGIWGELFDTSIWVSLSVICNGYVMPKLGTSLSYGALLSIGQLVSCGIFLMYHSSNGLVGSFFNDKAIAHELMLPVPSWMIFARRTVSLTIKAIILSSIVLPLSKLILGSRIDLLNINFLKFSLGFFLVNFFAGCGAIFLASVNSGDKYSSRVWVRYVYPLWFLGGSIFPFGAMNAAFPFFGKILLLNPIVYATELMRAATLGAGSHYLSFSVSATILFLYSIGLFWVGFFKLRKRFDFI